MKVLIIEDEQPASRKLIRMLEEVDPGTEVTGVLTSVEGSAEWLAANPPPELIFMDIELEDGTCFEIFEITDIKSPVIFTTAYDEFALKAFTVNSVDYLLKPVDPDGLKRAIDKYRAYHRKEPELKGLREVIAHLGSKRKERFLIRVGEHFRSVPTSGIDCFYVSERCNFILTESGMNYAIGHSLDSVEQLVDPGIFFRVSRNFIVNYNAIRDVIVYSSSRLKIILREWSGQEEILVSRERVPGFKNWMDR